MRIAHCARETLEEPVWTGVDRDRDWRGGRIFRAGTRSGVEAVGGRVHQGDQDADRADYFHHGGDGNRGDGECGEGGARGLEGAVVF